MEKSVGAFEIRRNFGKILQEIISKGDKYVVERHGEPVAVVVPLELYEQWKRSREALFQKIQQSQQRANLSAEEAEQLAKEAVKAARSEHPL